MANSKRKRRKRRDSLVLQLIIIVTIVLAVFEGRLVRTMIKQRSVMRGTVVTESGNSGEDSSSNEDLTSDVSQAEGTGSSSAALPEGLTSGLGDTALAGLPIGGRTSSGSSGEPETEVPKHDTVSKPDSPAIVRETSPAVDDSYFSDAAFIGDSRMQGFQNASGITTGTFFTSIGMSLSAMQSKNVIQTAEGNITVAAALSGGKYNKIYIMLGANDLGEYDWNEFKTGFISCAKRFQEIQPDAIFYICSVIYVEESKVDSSSSSYVNNTNVDKINSILLDICEEEGYYYLDLNEIMSNGYGSLIEGASSDGVHVYPKYCEQMLDYMKTHYVQESTSEEASSEAESESESETEPA